MRLPLHELGRTLASPAVIALVVLSGVVGAGILVVEAQQNTIPVRGYLAGAIEYGAGEYRVWIVLFDGSGASPGPDSIFLSLCGTTCHNFTADTNSAGVASFQFPLANGNWTLSAVSKYPFGEVGELNVVEYLSTLHPWMVYDFGNAVFPVVTGVFTHSGEVSIAAPGPNGTLPGGEWVGIAPWNGGAWESPPEPGGPFGTPPISAASAVSLGPVRSLPEDFAVSVPRGWNPKEVVVAVFNASDDPIYWAAYPPSVFGPQQLAVPPAEVARTYATQDLGFFLLLASMFVAYGTYAKDRASGLLDAVLAKPTTRERLVFRRLASVWVALGVAAIASVAVVQLAFALVVREPLPLTVVAYLGVGVFGGAAIFAVLIFWFSHLCRSLGGIVGASLGTFIVLAVAWPSLVFLAFALSGNTPLGGTFLPFVAIVDLLNPAQFVQLTVALSGSPGTSFPFGTLPWFTPALVATDAVAWLGSTLLGLFYWVRSRD